MPLYDSTYLWRGMYALFGDGQQVLAGSTCLQLYNRIKEFIIYYIMKYRKILIKYNAYISQPWKYKIMYFHSCENTRFDIFTGEKR